MRFVGSTLAACRCAEGVEASAGQGDDEHDLMLGEPVEIVGDEHDDDEADDKGGFGDDDIQDDGNDNEDVPSCRGQRGIPIRLPADRFRLGIRRGCRRPFAGDRDGVIPWRTLGLTA